jgi:hypothetical protein
LTTLKDLECQEDPLGTTNEEINHFRTMSNNNYDKEEDKGKSGAFIMLVILILLILNGIFGWV